MSGGHLRGWPSHYSSPFCGFCLPPALCYTWEGLTVSVPRGQATANLRSDLEGLTVSGGDRLEKEPLKHESAECARAPPNVRNKEGSSPF